MKRTVLLLTLCLTACMAWAQKALMIACTDGTTNYAPVSIIEEMSFSDDLTHLVLVSGTHTVEIHRDSIDIMGYTDMPEAFQVNYEGTSATIVNPYFLQGVTVSMDGANVTVNNDNSEVEMSFELKGSTSQGSFLYNGIYKSTIILNGVSITNPSGPAIDIECGKRIALELKKGTTNTLADGEGGDWKAALYCRGHLEIDKSGTLNVTGNTKHAISAKEYIQLKKSAGVINILGAKGDGIHCQQYFLSGGYEVNISNVADDGIQAELSADDPYEEEYPDGSINIQGGTFNITCTSDDVSGLKAGSSISISEAKDAATLLITMSGNGSKGMKADTTLDILAGTIGITNSGSVLTVGTDTQTAKCISADQAINLVGGTITLSTTGTGGKCIKSDGTFTLGDPATGNGPVLKASTTGGSSTTGTTNTGNTVSRGPGGGGGGGTWPGGGGSTTSGSSSAKAIKAMGAINLYGGESAITTLSSGAEGIESKTSITISGGHHYIKAYDDAINSSGQIIFDGGITVCYSTGNDAVDSNYGRSGAIVIGNGTVLAYTTKGGAEMGFDCDNNSYIQITGNGIAISAGGSQGGSNSSTLSTAVQGYAFVTSTLSYQTGRYYTLSDSSGKALVTYSFEGNVSSSYSLITATGMVKGSTYTIKYGTTAPSDATDSYQGLYIGGTSDAATNVTSLTAK
ncbi:MAG: carbohydrate-binding domain-containing protein [Bacteroidaceae bacterium]